MQAARALVLHLTFGASCGYAVEMLNEKVKTPPLSTKGTCVCLQLLVRDLYIPPLGHAELQGGEGLQRTCTFPHLV